MKRPDIIFFKERVTGDKLTLHEGDIRHPAFKRLLQVFEMNAFELDQVEIEENEEQLEVTGILFTTLGTFGATFTFIDTHDEEDPFDFELEAYADFSLGELLIKRNWVQEHDLTRLILEIAKKLPDFHLNYRSSYQNLMLITEIADLKERIPGLNLPLNNLYLAYLKSLDPDESREQFEFGFELEAGESVIRLNASLPLDETYSAQCLIIENEIPLYLNNGLKDLDKFVQNLINNSEVNALELENLIPEPLRLFEEFVIEDFVMHLNPTIPEISFLGLAIHTYRNIEIIPGFTIEDLGFHFNIHPEKHQFPRIYLNAEGTFNFSETINTALQIIVSTDPKEDWTIRMDAGIDLENLKQLEALSFIRLGDLNLPPQWFDAKAIAVDNLHITFNPWQAKLKNVSFSLTLTVAGQMIPGIRVKDPNLNINLNFE